jgi:di/tricarboxylate transporter
LQVLLVIASALGIGQAFATTGAAHTLADYTMDMVGKNPYLALAATYLITNILTEIITNNAAAVLVFPITLSVASAYDANILPFAMVIMMAASASFSTPLGYQTNLMVYGPGGYRFTDFIKVGLPLNLLIFLVVIILVPLIWPL